MSRRIKKIGILALLTVGLILLIWPIALKGVIEKGLESARKGGRTISWSGLSTGGRSAALESLTVWVPGPRVRGGLAIPLSLELQSVALAVDLSSLLTLSPRLSYSTDLYGGSLKGSATPGTTRSVVSAQVDNVEIGQHPQLAALGVRGGQVTAVVEDMAIRPEGPESGRFSIKLRGLVPPSVPAANTLLRTDTLGSLDLDAEGTVTPDSINVSSMQLSSRFGAAAGTLMARQHLSRTPSIRADVQVSLSEAGVTTLGPWLPFIPGGGLDSSTTEFTVLAESVLCSAGSGTVTVLRLPFGCVRLQFSKRS